MRPQHIAKIRNQAIFWTGISIAFLVACKLLPGYIPDLFPFLVAGLIFSLVHGIPYALLGRPRPPFFREAGHYYLPIWTQSSRMEPYATGFFRRVRLYRGLPLYCEGGEIHRGITKTGLLFSTETPHLE